MGSGHMAAPRPYFQKKPRGGFFLGRGRGERFKNTDPQISGRPAPAWIPVQMPSSVRVPQGHVVESVHGEAILKSIFPEI